MVKMNADALLMNTRIKHLVTNSSSLINVKVVGLEEFQLPKKMQNTAQYFWKFRLKGDEGMACILNGGWHTANYQGQTHEREQLPIKRCRPNCPNFQI